jgi:hypothetical protein
MTFKNVEELSVWLNENGVDTAEWGQAGSKTAESLYQEIQAGETLLTGPPLRRVVQVVEVVARQGEYMLMEAAQEMGDGRIRQRQQLPAEKIKPGEEPFQAGQRCLWEEVGVPPENVQFLSATLQGKYERPSPSYPGLITQYTVMRVETAVTHLPIHDFWHDNAAHTHGDPVRRHLWTWVAGKMRNEK